MPTLDQIQAKLKKLQAQADVLIARKAQVAVDQIRELMLKHGLTTKDIEATAKARRAARGLNGHAGTAKAKASASGKPAKYRDHKTGATWTGHGRAPGWIASVKDRTQFLIDGASELRSTAKAVVKQAKGGKGQPKGAQPPKYLDPKSGATWSGRGPAPAWLASVKDRTRFLIDGAAAKPATKAATKAGKTRAAATSGVVSKKAAAKKAVAKKAVASKKTTAKRATAGRKVVAKKAAVKPAAKKATATKAARKAPVRKVAAKTVATDAAAAPQTSTVQASA
jgi:DNA-binding protein H-NS